MPPDYNCYCAKQESAKKLHKQALAVAEDKACIDAAVTRVTKLLETGGSKQKNKFEKRINPDLRGKVSYVTYH
jgi:hypothetical protein